MDESSFFKVMKTMIVLAIITLFSLICLVVKGDEVAPLADYIAIDSSAVEKLGWSRQAVMVTEDGELIDESGMIVQVAETAAVDEAARESGSIADAARTAAQGAIAVLNDAADGMATDAYQVALSFAPETDRANITGFVVKETTNGSVDTQWVWYNRSFPVSPVRWVEYKGDYISASIKAKWISWSSEGESVVVDGVTWRGCHKCEIERPTWAQNVPCVTLPNEIVGGANGFDIGDATLTLDGVLPFSGEVVNEGIGMIETWDNGILKERKPIE